MVVQAGGFLGLRAVSNLAGRRVLIEPNGQARFYQEQPTDPAALARLDPASGGVLASNVAPGLSLEGFDELWIGNTEITNPFTPANNTYRIGSAGDLGLVRLTGGSTSILSGDNAVRFGTGVDRSLIYLDSANSYSGGTTVNKATLYASVAGAFGTGSFLAMDSTIYARGDAFPPGISPIFHNTGARFDTPVAFADVTVSREGNFTSQLILDGGGTISGRLTLEGDSSLHIFQSVAAPISLVDGGGRFYVEVPQGQQPTISSDITVVGQAKLGFWGRIGPGPTDMMTGSPAVRVPLKSKALFECSARRRSTPIPCTSTAPCGWPPTASSEPDQSSSSKNPRDA